jgi:hypothetical protein
MVNNRLNRTDKNKQSLDYSPISCKVWSILLNLIIFREYNITLRSGRECLVLTSAVATRQRGDLKVTPKLKSPVTCPITPKKKFKKLSNPRPIAFAEEHQKGHLNTRFASASACP